MKIHELLEQDPNTPSIQILSRLSKPHWGCCAAQVKKIFVCCLEKEVPPGNCGYAAANKAPATEMWPQQTCSERLINLCRCPSFISGALKYC